MDTRSVYETDDEVQALALQEALESEGIAAVLVNHRDTAYPGINDRQRHGTEIRVELDQVAQATHVIEGFRAVSRDPWAGLASHHLDNAGFIGGRRLLTKSQLTVGSRSVSCYKLTVSKGRAPWLSERPTT
jgi:hypothetical protein